ncbi:glycosyltransferase [Bacillus solimangrovi]|uniref:Glycosyl transferase family 2 n=1 Tax=Bacillus solimangrovi TaxID=1305675 RepID=A0A1E5LEN8_9BACI|nr:glycosyltransferase [Bacillus solimangrovi]OEH92502.1 glycosyl transferase family 2 [Bacillus solimangrovi]
MVFLYISFAIFTAFVIFQTIYIMIPLFKNEKRKRSKISKQYSFSVIVPAFNEKKVIQHCISGFCTQNYANAELILVNDGSTDDTMILLRDELDLKIIERKLDSRLKYQQIRTIYQSKINSSIYVVDKLNGGKADALNAGIALSTQEIIITLDADCYLDQNSINEMNHKFQEENVLACGGTVLIAQAFEGHIQNLRPTFKIKGVIKYQFLQYLTAFYLHKRAQETLEAITVISGAFGAFRRETLFNIQGFRRTIGEDMDITLKLHKWIKENNEKWRIAFVPTASCYTECPDTLKDMFKQRVRWQKAFIECLIHYRKCYFNKFSIRFSLFFLVDQFIIGTMNAFPVVATPILLLFNTSHVVLLLLLGIGATFLFIYQSITTIYVSSLHGVKFSMIDTFRIFFFLPIEIFFFRMINLSFVIYGTMSYFYKPQSWDKFERSGNISWKGEKKYE